jgi:hypothetical protein
MNIYIHKDGQQHGPFSLDDVNSKALAGEFAPSDPAWIEGWPEWRSLAAIPGFVQRASPPPFKSQASPPPIPPAVMQASQLPTAAAAPATALFLYIPVARLVAMSLVTLGLYEVYWIYRNWRFLNERDNLRIQPFWRAVFGVFFIKSLLTAIKNDKAANNILPATFSPGALATGWIIFVILGALSQRSPDPAVNIFGLIISAPSFAFLLPVQNYINRVNESLPIRPSYYQWSAGQIVLLVFGIVVWFLTLVNLTHS